MTQDRKYFGMTPKQIAILAGLAILAFLLFGVAGWLALRGGPNSLASAPSNTPAPQATSTPFVLPTASPTETPTPVPYEILIPEGWVQFKTGLVEVWLPKEFKKGDSKLIKDSANLAAPELVLARPTSKTIPNKMFVVVSYEPMTADSLDAYLTNKIASLSPDTRVASKQMVSVNSQDAVQFVFEMRKNNAEFNDLVYVFLDGSTVWYVEYIAQINEYFTMVDMFKTSAKTFRIVR
jgi:hypothetical protein